MAESTDVLSKLISQLNDLADKGILSASRKDMRSLQKYEKTFGRMIEGISDAYESGFERQADELQEAQIKMTRQVSKYSAQIAKCINKLQTAVTDAEKKAASERINALRREMTEKLKTQNEVLESELAMNKKITEDYKNRQKGLRERTKESFTKLEFGDDLENTLNKLTGAITDFDGTTSLLKSSISGLAGLFASKAATSAFKHRQAGGEGIGQMAAQMAGLSKGLMVLGATVGAVFAVFKAFQAIESAGKKVNKELITQIGATDLMRDGAMSVADETDRLRRIVTSADFSLDLGLSPDEAQNLVVQINKLGMTFRSMGGDGNKLKETLTVMRQAAYSLGISSEDAAEHMNKFRLELGLSENLNKRMGEEFKTIRDYAKQSAFGTADFFSKVKSLTEGLGKLNVRTSQASKILVNMSKVLGPEAGEAFTKGLIGAFANEGYTDRIKRLLTTRGTDVNKALARSATAQAKAFGQNYLGDAFVKEAFGGQYTSGEQILSDIQSGRLSAEDLQRVLGRLQASNSRQAQGASRELYKLMEASAYKQGRMGQVRALAQADAGATLATDSSRVLSFLGGMEGVVKPSLGGLKMLENLGYGMEQIEDYRKILTLKSAEFEELKRRKGALTEDEQKRFGVRKDDKGRLISLKTGEVIKDLQAYLMANSDDLEKKFGDMKSPSLESIMKESIVATQTTADVINAHLGGIMQGVYDVVFGFYNAWFGTKQSDTEKAAQAGAISELETIIKGMEDFRISRGKRIAEIGQELKGEKNLEKRDKLIRERDELKEKQEKQKPKADLARETLSFLRQNKMFGRNNATDVLDYAFTVGAGKMVSKGQKSGLVSSGVADLANLEQIELNAIAQSLGSNTMMEYMERVVEAGVGTKTATGLLDALRAKGVRADPDIVTNQVDLLYKGKSYTSDRQAQEAEYGNKYRSDAEVGDIELNVPSPTSPQARKGRQEDAKEAAEAQAKNSKLQKANEDATYEAMKRIRQDEFEANLRAKLGGIEGFGTTTGDLSQLRTRLMSIAETDANREKLNVAKDLFAQAQHLDYISVDDAFVRKGQRPIKVNPNDNALFFKDGGPMDPRGGGGPRAVFNITVNGGPDLEARVMSAVDKGLRKNRVVVQPN